MRPDFAFCNQQHCYLVFTRKFRYRQRSLAHEGMPPPRPPHMHVAARASSSAATAVPQPPAALRRHLASHDLRARQGKSSLGR